MGNSWNVQVGKYKLMLVEEIEVTNSVELLSDTAVITLPATAYNKALEIENKIARGDKVIVEFGYDGNLITEFEGYLESIKTDGGSLKLNCEDGLFQYRKTLPNKELVNPTLQDILDYVHQTVKGFTISCDYEFSYEKFVISNATGYDVLKKIQEEAKPNIYLKGSVLHIHPQYSEIFGTAAFDFAVNIDAEGCDIQYKLETERRLLIEVEAKKQNGETIKIEEGTTGGDKMTLHISGVVDETSLRNIAKEELKRRVYAGYEGSFTAWLVPYVCAGYKISLHDDDYKYKDGVYYVLSVVTTFSASGGKRVIKPGKKLSDGKRRQNT